MTAIVPDYHSLLWRLGTSNFWAPLGLDSSTYALESPAGAAPETLNKCGNDVAYGTQYLPCTVITLEGRLSAENLNAQLDNYRAVEDDVWSEENVSLTKLFCALLIVV